MYSNGIGTVLVRSRTASYSVKVQIAERAVLNEVFGLVQIYVVRCSDFLTSKRSYEGSRKSLERCSDVEQATEANSHRS